MTVDDLQTGDVFDRNGRVFVAMSRVGNKRICRWLGVRRDDGLVMPTASGNTIIALDLDFTVERIKITEVWVPAYKSDHVMIDGEAWALKRVDGQWLGVKGNECRVVSDAPFVERAYQVEEL